MRRVLVMRHAERMDDLFPDWITQCHASGHYRPHDLNQVSQLGKCKGLLQPMKLPVKREPFDYEFDTPITEMGNVTAQMIGRALLARHMRPGKEVVVVQGLNCLQTSCSPRRRCVVCRRRAPCCEPPKRK